MSNDVIQLTDREHLRGSALTGVGSRVSMYLGSIAENGESNPESLQVSLREAIDNSKDVLIANGGNELWVFTDKKATEPLGMDKYEGKSNKNCKKWWRYTVADSSIGIPIKETVDIRGNKITMMQLALENLRAGSKFSKDSDLVGMNGVGISAVNMVSAEFICYSHLNCHKLSETTDEVKELLKKCNVTEKNKEGKYLKITWHLGLRHSIEIVDAKEDSLLLKYFPKVLPSTVTSFIPDPTIHGGTTQVDVRPEEFKFFGFLYPKVTIYIDGKKLNTKIGYKYSDSLKIDCVAQGLDEIKNPSIKIDYSLEVSKDFNVTKREFSVNTLDCQVGKHVRMFEAAWAEAFCTYFKDKSIEKYASMGMNVVFILRCPEPSFSSQTKERLATVQGFESAAPLPKLVKSFTNIIKQNEEEFKTAYERIVEYHNKKQSVGKLKELKKQLGDLATGNNRSSSAFLPKKLSDCPCKDRSKAECFIVEGNSAAGSFNDAKAGLDNVAIMPLRGKMLNVVGLDVSEALENAEANELSHLFGGVNEIHMDISKLHFGKFIISTDADSDGYQIASLVLGDIVQNHLYLLGTPEKEYEDSIVYIAKAPLFMFVGVDGKKVDKYFYAGEEKLVAEFQKKHKFKTLKRFKGLGEMGASDIKGSYLNPDTRQLMKVKPTNIDGVLGLIGKKQYKKELMIEEKIISLDVIELED